MTDLILDLVAAEKRLFEGAIKSVSVETSEGEIGFLKGHEPFLGELRENGVVVITFLDNTVKVIAVNGGFVSVVSHKVVILANRATWAEEVEPAIETEKLAELEINSPTYLSIKGKLRAVARNNS